MRAIFSILCVYFYTLLLSATSSVGDDRSWLSPVIDLVEMDYVDMCEKRASATWAELIGSPKGLTDKMDKDKTFGVFAQRSRHDIQTAYNQHTLGPNDELLKRKVHLLLHPGDVLLQTEQWIRLVTFADKAQNKLRFATNYDCGNGANCTLKEFHNSFARQQDEKISQHMKQSWERNLPDMDEYATQILPLLRNASIDYKSVEEYWDSLVEYEGAILKARELWESIRPLYIKLHKYIALRLKGSEAVGESLPLYMLRSLTGDDWSNIIEKLLPKHPAIYQEVQANLQLKNFGGANAYKAASKLISELRLGDIKPDLWSESMFNSTCPATLVDWCKPNKLRVVTCKDVSIGNYLDAHETTMKIVYKQVMASYSNNSYTLREAPRYSAIYEAIPGFISLLALSPHVLSRNELFPFETFNLNPNHHRMVLQLILALRDLPKLNYYLAADEWRLKVLMGKVSPSEAAADWMQFRKEFSLLDTSGTELLADPYAVFNKPFIGKFMGIILKYQIYQSFAEELMSDELDLVNQVAENSHRLSDIMLQGYSTKWPELVSDLLAQKENGLEYTGITDYYRFLDEYLDSHFDPSYNIADVIDDYYEAPKKEVEDDEEAFDLGEDPVVVEVPLSPTTTIKSTDTDPSGSGTTPALPLEVKKKDTITNAEPPQEESYNVYWWIGIAVALAVVVVLIAIIARKRHNHRKELERQRKENSRA